MSVEAKTPKLEVEEAKAEENVPSTTTYDGFSAESVTVKPEPQHNASSTVSSDTSAVNFYYMDGFESHETGRTMLFGKTLINKEWKSACVVIERMPRSIILVPAQGSHSVEAEQLYTRCRVEAEEEVENDPQLQSLSMEDRRTKVAVLTARKERNAMMIEVRNELMALTGVPATEMVVKWVKRGYAFERAGMSRSARDLDVIKISYPYSRRSVHPDIVTRGGKFFTHIFNSRQSSLEALILKRRIQGPGWLKIENFKEVTNDGMKVSWCHSEYSVETHKNIRVWNAKRGNKAHREAAKQGITLSPHFDDGFELDPPPMKVLALSIKSRKVPTSGSSVEQLEPFMVAGAVVDNWFIDQPLPKALTRSRGFVFARGHETMVIPMDAPQLLQSDALSQLAAGKGVEICRTEAELLDRFVQRVGDEDPDIILAHGAYKHELELLRSRFMKHRTRFWHRLSRLKRSQNEIQNMFTRNGNDKFTGRLLTVGRLPVDTQELSMEHSRGHLSYDLNTLTTALLNKNLGPGETPRKRDLFDDDNLAKYYRSGKLFLHACQHTLGDCNLALRIAEHLEVVPLTRQLTNIAGNLWVRSLQGARAERNEFLLMHEFWSKKFICPDKNEVTSTKKDAAAEEMADMDDMDAAAEAATGSKNGKKKAAYSGGLVLEPKKGLYTTYILLLDFNSLYPSIIQEFNLCFTTIERPDESRLTDEFEAEVPPSVDADGRPLSLGILPAVLESLVRRRREVKKLMADAEKKGDKAAAAVFNTRQTALKLTANSMYGCLGFSSSRFYCKPLAALVTRQGRKILGNAKAKAESELGLEVVYGDTDSIMIDSRVPAEFVDPDATGDQQGQIVPTWRQNYERAVGLGHRVKSAVNSLYKKLELDIDGIFARMLLIKKKKYASVQVSPQQGSALPRFKEEYKGLDMVRRDWCRLSKTASEDILKRLLSPNTHTSVDETLSWTYEYLRNMSLRLDSGKCTVEDLTITKSLTKAPSQYPDARSQPHVLAALRLKERTGREAKAGDLVPYVITMPLQQQTGEDAAADDVTGGVQSQTLAQRAYMPEEVLQREDLHPDIHWYKTHQVLPPVARLLEPLEQTSQAQLAECLGLDGSRYNQQGQAHNDATEERLGWEDLATLGLEKLLNSAERFRDIERSLPSVPCPSAVCGPKKHNILLLDLLRANSVAPNAMLAKEVLEGRDPVGTFRCNSCQYCLPPQYIRTQIRVLLTKWARNAERVFTCVECSTATRRLCLANGHRCPQPTCFRLHAKTLNGKELRPTMSKHKWDQHLEFLSHLLKVPMYIPDSTPDKTDGTSRAEAEKIMSVEVDLVNQVRTEVAASFEPLRNQSDYQRLQLKTIFASCINVSSVSQIVASNDSATTKSESIQVKSERS